MRRREFITFLGGAAAAWPINVRAQQKLPRIGVLVGGPSPPARDFELVHQLAQLGYTEGRNVTYEIRGAEGDSKTVNLAAGGRVIHRRTSIEKTTHAVALRSSTDDTICRPCALSGF